MYQIHNENGDVQRSDGAVIPNNPANRDWRKYQAWVDRGNTPEPMAEPQELLPNPLIVEIENATTITEIKTVVKKMLG